MSQARRCRFPGLVHLQPILSPFIFFSFHPALTWTWSSLPSLTCLLFRWLLTFPFSFYSFTRLWTLPPLQPRWPLPAVCRASVWGSWTIGGASVTCVGQQEPVKEIRYIAFWSHYQVVAINGAKPQESPIHRKQEVTESENMRRKQKTSAGFFNLYFKLSLLLFLSPPIMSTLMWYFTTITH